MKATQTRMQVISTFSLRPFVLRRLLALAATRGAATTTLSLQLLVNSSSPKSCFRALNLYSLHQIPRRCLHASSPRTSRNLHCLSPAVPWPRRKANVLKSLFHPLSSRNTASLVSGTLRSVGACGMTERKRFSSSVVSDEEVRKCVDVITDKFLDARELLEDAREAVDSVYFNSDMREAQQAVADTLEAYKQLLETLTLEQRKNVARTIGLKMEELKAHQQMIEDSLH